MKIVDEAFDFIINAFIWLVFVIVVVAIVLAIGRKVAEVCL